MSEQFQSFMLHNDILHQTSCVDTSSQNGLTERKNRHFLETARALLFQMRVLKHFWSNVVSTACFLSNQMPSSILNWATLFQTLFPHKSLFPIEPRVFLCAFFVCDVRPHVSKLDPKSLKNIFLGYSRVQKGYRCYCPSLRRYLVSANVTFLENTPFSLDPIHTSQGENDDLLVYTLTLQALASDPPLTKPFITQVYAQRLHPQSQAFHRCLRHRIQFLVMTFLLLSVKVNVNVLIQSPHFSLITIFHLILVRLLYPSTLFHYLTRFLKPYLILVGLVL